MKTKSPGRPPIGDKRMKRIQVVLDDRTIEIARQLGGGNLSAGLREAVKRPWRLPH